MSAPPRAKSPPHNHSRYRAYAKASGELAASKSPQRLSRALTNAMVGLAVTGKLNMGRAELREIYAGTLSILD